MAEKDDQGAPADAEAPAQDQEDETPVQEAPAEEAVGAAQEADEPAETAPEAVAETEEPATGAAAPAEAPKPKKRKRLPRALRPSKTRPKRERATERRPLVRLPKPEHERGRRQERQGTVVSDAMEKTIVVKVDVIKAHPKYKKVVRRSTKFHAHDERNEAKVGDIVRIVETRPLSKQKRWRLVEVVEAAK
jgi:small subunit ribosomal protein S17